MNYTNQNISAAKSVPLGPIEASPHKSRNFTISHQAISVIAMVVDTLVIFATSTLGGIVYSLTTYGRLGEIGQFTSFAFVVAILFITLARSSDIYTLRELLNFKSQVIQTATKWIGVFLFMTAVAFAMKAGNQVSRGATLFFAIFGLVGLIGARVVWRIALARGLAANRFSSRKVVVITEQASAVDADFTMALTSHGLKPVHKFVLPDNSARGRKDVITQAIAAVRGSDVEEIIVGANPDHWLQLKKLLSELRVLPIPVNFVPIGPLSELFKLTSYTIGETLTFELQRSPRTPLELMFKRAIDVVVSVTALVLFLPLLLIAAVAIKLDSPGPVIFRQRRCGFNGRTFHILKFRTMSVLEDGATIVPAQPEDARVTRIGKWLRRTSIDELPQLLNVLQGTMSIVGPRPHAMAHDHQFDKLVGNYAFRQHVKPGVTGWAQVNGHRGQMSTVADVEQRIKYDLSYIDNWNIALDFKIMLMTLIEVVHGDNAY